MKEGGKKELMLFLLGEITSALTTLNIHVLMLSNSMKTRETLQCKLLLAVNEENISMRKLLRQQRKYV